MTSRTSPVGVIVIALAGLIATGCNVPTAAVFQALLDPTEAAVPSPEVEPVESDVAFSEAPTWWPHPEGYAMVLPPGWSGVAVDPEGTVELLEAVTVVMPELGERMASVLEGSQARVSAIAADADALGEVTPVLVVLAEPMDGRRPHVVKTDVRTRITGLPWLSGPLSAHDVVFSTAKAVRYDYTIADPDLGEVRVFSYLFRFGRTAYLVNFAASPELADEAELVFDAIVASLRFGV
jgi:hypothetical protein